MGIQCQEVKLTSNSSSMLVICMLECEFPSLLASKDDAFGSTKSPVMLLRTFFGSKGSTTTLSVSLMSSRQKGHPFPLDSSQLLRQLLHSKWPHGSRRVSLLLSVQILQI